MIYKPDGREGRIAYCYVTQGYDNHGSPALGGPLKPDGTFTFPSHPWSAEAHDCTDVRNFVTNRVFNNMALRDIFKFFYYNLTESAYAEGMYHVSFDEKDAQVQCDELENMVCFMTS